MVTPVISVSLKSWDLMYSVTRRPVPFTSGMSAVLGCLIREYKLDDQARTLLCRVEANRQRLFTTSGVFIRVMYRPRLLKSVCWIITVACSHWFHSWHWWKFWGPSWWDISSSLFYVKHTWNGGIVVGSDGAELTFVQKTGWTVWRDVLWVTSDECYGTFASRMPAC